jgi:ubiquinone/menaquinone biosynthesis C-methylase UbiE
MSYAMESIDEAKRLEFQAEQPNYNIPNELRYLQLKGNEKVLDVGCGTGLLARELKKKYPNIEIDACDFSDIRVQQAKKLSSNINYFVADAQNLQIESKYDVVVSRYVFEHLPSPVLAAQEIYKACKDGGKVYIVDFDGIFLNHYSTNEELNKSLELMRESFSFDLFVGRKLPSLLKKAGFNRIQWKAELNTFDEKQLQDEIENCHQRCLNARPLIERTLGSSSKAEEFIRDYVEAIENEETVLFYNKFMAWGIK